MIWYIIRVCGLRSKRLLCCFCLFLQCSILGLLLFCWNSYNGAMDIVHFCKSTLAHPPVLHYQIYDLCVYCVLMTKREVSFVHRYMYMNWPSFLFHFYHQTTAKLLFSHLDRTCLVNKGYIIWPRELSFFFFFSVWVHCSQSGSRICFILPARRTRCMIIIGIITWYKPSRSINTQIFISTTTSVSSFFFLFLQAFTTDFEVHWGQHPLRPELVESTYFLYEVSYLCVSVSQS